MKKCPVSIIVKRIKIKTMMKHHSIGHGRIKVPLTLYSSGNRHSQTGRTQGQDIPFRVTLALNKFPRIMHFCQDTQ